MNKRPCIAVIGLGYVGYPLAVAFGQHYKTIGFDIDGSRIDQLNRQYDRTQEIDKNVARQATHLHLTNDEQEIAAANIYIITASTPVNDNNEPDLSEILSAAKTVGMYISNGDTVILESTVYPGVTEGVFAQTLASISGLSAENEFNLGYSPERINPGDPLHKLQNIVKIVSATNPSTLDLIYSIYKSIIPEGVHKADNIQTAELSKLIENTQRDINIGFLNEVYQLSGKLNLDFNKVLECARTKWNFLHFKPGLVGGHCVAVDPYYLIHTQCMHDSPSQVTLSARLTNEEMVDFVANSFVKRLTRKGAVLPDTQVLILGASFKADCPDMRNSKALSVIKELMQFGMKPEIFDPVAEPSSLQNLTWHSELPVKEYDGILMLTPHTRIMECLSERQHPLLKPEGTFFSLDSNHGALFS